MDLLAAPSLSTCQPEAPGRLLCPCLYAVLNIRSIRYSDGRDTPTSSSKWMATGSPRGIRRRPRCCDSCLSPCTLGPMVSSRLQNPSALLTELYRATAVFRDGDSSAPPGSI